MDKSQNIKNIEIEENSNQETLLKPFIKLRTERFSTISHLCGALLFFFGTIFLTIHAIGNPLGVIFSLIYGLSNIFLFFSSTMCHSQRKEDNDQDIWTIMDHIAIFFLIAGTYTAVAYYNLQGGWRIGIITAQWVFAITGLVLKLIQNKVIIPRWVNAVIYLIQGWMILIALAPLRLIMPSKMFSIVLIAGLVYSVGTLFYMTKKPKLWPGVFGAHDLWHMFVLIGATLFYIVVWNSI